MLPTTGASVEGADGHIGKNGGDLAGRRTRMTWPDAFYVTYDYLVTGETAHIYESGTAALGTYAYDDLGRRVSLTRGNGAVTSYGYDPVNTNFALRRVRNSRASTSGTMGDFRIVAGTGR